MPETKTRLKLRLKNLAMLPSYFDYIFVHLRQRARLIPKWSPKFLSNLSPIPTQKAWPDLQLCSTMKLTWISGDGLSTWLWWNYFGALVLHWVSENAAHSGWLAGVWWRWTCRWIAMEQSTLTQRSLLLFGPLLTLRPKVRNFLPKLYRYCCCIACLSSCHRSASDANCWTIRALKHF